jgi:very-short-patch-repair endonuclease
MTEEGNRPNCFIADKKRDYLIKTLSRTKRKDYENYIINAIYHQLNRLDVKPITQQYIKRSDGKYALVDLYFPQLNYGIECDEAYHINNDELDLVRVLTMEDMLDSVKETKGFILKRVRAYEGIESIDRQIKEIVAEIKKLLSESEIEEWDIYRNPAEYAIKKKKITVEDRLQFDTIVSLSKCFGKDYKNMQRCFFNVNHGYYIWCPKLAIYVDGKPKSVAKGWINILSDDWEKIAERNEDNTSIATGVHLQKRLTFAKGKDVLGRNRYRFIGIFDYSEELSSENENVYIRQANNIDLGQWLNK